MNLYEDLKWRGLVQDISDEELIDKLNGGGLTFYIGTDPTADSMHIGHYSSFLISKRLAKAGHPLFSYKYKKSKACKII